MVDHNFVDEVTFALRHEIYRNNILGLRLWLPRPRVRLTNNCLAKGSFKVFIKKLVFMNTNNQHFSTFYEYELVNPTYLIYICKLFELYS